MRFMWPPAGGAEVWQALYAAGRPRGLRAFGVEAQRVLRLEKGHLIVGQDTDGLTDPFEANARMGGGHEEAVLHRAAQPAAF